MFKKFINTDHNQSWRHDKFGFIKNWRSLFAGKNTFFLENLMIWLRQFGGLLKATFVAWNKRDPFNNSIIIAYYTIFSLPGLLVIVISVAGYFYDKQEITTRISSQIESVMGGDTASDIESIVGRASETESSTLASVFGIATLLFGATGVFYQLQQMLNKIWQVKPKVRTAQRILELIRDRLFSFGLVLAVGFLLLVSLVISAALSALSTWVTTYLSESVNILFRIFDIVVSLGVITFLFAAIFKFLPDAKIMWKDVWLGASLTAILFVLAKFALGLYFGKSDPGSTYGAAGSIILIMLWVSYTGLILLFGAEFTHVRCIRNGTKAEPTPVAVADSKG
jgi:membrane protein